MFLIYVSAKPEIKDCDEKDCDCNDENDLQPVMLALTHDGSEYILREADSKDIKAKKAKGLEDIKRMFVKVQCADKSCDSKVTYDSKKRKCDDEQGESRCCTDDAQMAVALATIYFPKGSSNPSEVDYVNHVKGRTRLADKLVVVGYADKDCTMEQSELLAFQRAIAVRKTLEKGKVTLPIVTISRPHCAYAENDERSRRVEVTALFYGSCGGPDEEDKKRPRFEKGDDKSLTKPSKKSSKEPLKALANKSPKKHSLKAIKANTTRSKKSK